MKSTKYRSYQVVNKNYVIYVNCKVQIFFGSKYVYKNLDIGFSSKPSNTKFQVRLLIT